MNKYRISIRPSVLRHRLAVALAALLSISVWTWQENIMPLQWAVQLALTLAIGATTYKLIKRTAVTSIVSLSADGEWLDLHQQQVFRLTAASRVTSWLLWVQLSSASGQRQWHRIYRDAVSDEDYRRIARTIYKMQQGQIHAVT